MPSPILRDTIKKLRARKAQLERQVKGPLEEIRQIEADLAALEAVAKPGARRPRAAPGANQAAILRAIRNGATTPKEIAERTGLPTARVNSSLTSYKTLVTRGMNGLTLTKAGREKLRALEAGGGSGAGRR